MTGTLTMMKTVLEFSAYKQQQRKIAMLTCYDAALAQIFSQTDVDCLLVGDSVAMVCHGFPSTIYATMEMMALHTEAVRRGDPSAFIIADMPFTSFRKTLADTVENARRLMVAGANAVKIEGIDGHADHIAHLVQSGIPVMGHLGLVPQSVNTLGGYKVQGKEDAAAADMLRQARALEKAGAFAIVLECVPTKLAQEITQALSIPTIGIGAGNLCDGQVLVWQDMTGLMPSTPKFVRRYMEVGTEIGKAANRYVAEVKESSFPSATESYN